jgi:hypothetical protein
MDLPAIIDGKFSTIVQAHANTFKALGRLTHPAVYAILPMNGYIVVWLSLQ